MKRLETIANISVIVAALVLVAFLGQMEWQRHNESARTKKVLVGETVTLPGVQFAAQSKTLVLAISTHCHFCKDSEPFYKDLAAKSQGRLRIVAVLPQPLSESQAYVRNAIAPSVEVVQSRLDSIGVSGTPTLLLVDSNGKVQQAWVGKLDDQGQRQVQSYVM
jgi:hypothetical protein